MRLVLKGCHGFCCLNEAPAHSFSKLAVGMRHAFTSSLLLVLLILPAICLLTVLSSSRASSPAQQVPVNHSAHASAVQFDAHSSNGTDSTARQHQDRCQLTRNKWCGVYHVQKPVPTTPAAAHNKTCPGQCSGVGVCNAMTGLCDCPAGWAGPDCSQEQKRPCTDGRSAFKGPGTLPSSHIGPDKRDLNWTAGGWRASRCAGICDDNRGLCYCDTPHLLSQNGTTNSPGAVSIRGRPLGDHCQPSTTQDGQPTWAVGKPSYDKIYGAQSGWCTVAVGTTPAQNCRCNIDGAAGTWCELLTEQVCANSCSGHGRCDGGFCICDSGWFGHDCAGRVQGQQPDAINESQALRERPWLADSLVPPVAAAQHAPGATRKRPLVYVYDIPAWAAARMLQYRAPKQSCTWRWFGENNVTHLNTDWLYPAELLLHELLLASPHRTLNPEEADLFYVPAYVTCFAWPVHGWADYPWWYSEGGPRVSHMTKMLLEMKQHIQHTYPYWNRTDGRDHIWLAPHDEGACWYPTEVYRHSIILTHWGRMDQQHTSNTAYTGDNYTQPHFDPGHKGFETRSWTELIEGHPCYSPNKDLVIPAPKFPPHYRWSPLLGAPPQPRNTLLYFRGDVGKTRLPNYSRGIRQRLAALAQTPEWKEKFKVKIGTRDEVPGDGWSARAEDAILHGCIPAIIQDNVHAPFESILDYEAFSLRVPEQQLDNLAQLLAAVPEQELQQMQHNLRQVWHRFVYLSQPLIQRSATEIRQQWQRKQNQQQGRKLAVSLAAANSTEPGAHMQRANSTGGPNNDRSSSRVQIKVRARVRGAAGGQLSGDGGQSLGDEGQPFVLTAQHMEDDAFGTLLQVFENAAQAQREAPKTPWPCKA